MEIIVLHLFCIFFIGISSGTLMKHSDDEIKAISSFCSKDKLCCGDDLITSPLRNGKIYLRPKSAAESIGSWYQNVEYCRNRCAEMVTIQSKDENEYVKEWLRSSGITSKGAWLGGQIINGRKNIQWLNGDPSSYSNWEDGEPNGDGITCLHFGLWNRLTWWDFYCTDIDQVAIMCQKQ